MDLFSRNRLANLGLQFGFGFRQRLSQRLNDGFNIPSLGVDNRDTHMTRRIKFWGIQHNEEMQLTLCGSICLRRTERYKVE
jgi:hypothetical protein